MHPLHNRSSPGLQQESLAIGSVLVLKVIICHTRKWWDDDAGSRNDGDPLGFTYEVHALPDDWAIGGQKKGSFSAKVSYPGDL